MSAFICTSTCCKVTYYVPPLVRLIKMISVSVSATNITDYEHHLVEKLTKHYRIGGRPVLSNKEAVVVYYDLKINKLEKLVRIVEGVVMIVRIIIITIITITIITVCQC